MVDGYTVEEAASVLGVPRERVWELLARGVLTGSTDLGGAMRVRLRVDQRIEPPAPPSERPADAAAPSPSDIAPFRELLTEFRSLTERYGQALLALGEARGEVATLRSRVELLEARVDLRLPPPAEPISATWGATVPPAQREPAAEPFETARDETAARSEPAGDAEPEAVAAPEPEAVAAPEPEPAATEGAEPDASSAAYEAEEQPVTATAAPAEAEPVPSAASDSAAAGVEASPADIRADDDERAARRRTRAGRRATESFADALARAEDPSPSELPGAAETAAALAALREGQPDARGEPDHDATLPRDTPSAEPVPVAELSPATQEPAGAAPAPEAPEPEAVTAPEAAAPQPETPQPEAATPPAAAERPAEGPEQPDDVEPAWDPDVYSADIEEPDWISADDVAVAPTGWRPPPVAPDRPERPVAPERRATPEGAASDERPDARGPVGPQTTEAADRQTSQAREPWPWGPVPDEAAGEKGGGWPRSRQLDEGLAALDALAHPGQPAGERPSPAEREGPAWSGRTDPARPSSRPAQAWSRTSPPPPLGVRSPASRAYRRLRRIFPT